MYDVCSDSHTANSKISFTHQFVHEARALDIDCPICRTESSSCYNRCNGDICCTATALQLHHEYNTSTRACNWYVVCRLIQVVTSHTTGVDDAFLIMHAWLRPSRSVES